MIGTGGTTIENHSCSKLIFTACLLFQSAMSSIGCSLLDDFCNPSIYCGALYQIYLSFIIKNQVYG